MTQSVTKKQLKKAEKNCACCLPKNNIRTVSGHLVCGNCGKESSIYDITEELNNYCGYCGIRLYYPYM